MVGWLSPGKDDRRASQLASQVGLNLAPISHYCLEPLARGGLFFGFASTDEQAIRLGVSKLAAALAHLCNR